MTATYQQSQQHHPHRPPTPVPPGLQRRLRHSFNNKVCVLILYAEVPPWRFPRFFYLLSFLFLCFLCCCSLGKRSFLSLICVSECFLPRCKLFCTRILYTSFTVSDICIFFPMSRRKLHRLVVFGSSTPPSGTLLLYLNFASLCSPNKFSHCPHLPPFKPLSSTNRYFISSAACFFTLFLICIILQRRSLHPPLSSFPPSNFFFHYGYLFPFGPLFYPLTRTHGPKRVPPQPRVSPLPFRSLPLLSDPPPPFQTNLFSTPGPPSVPIRTPSYTYMAVPNGMT